MGKCKRLNTTKRNCASSSEVASVSEQPSRSLEREPSQTEQNESTEEQLAIPTNNQPSDEHVEQATGT